MCMSKRSKDANQSVQFCDTVEYVDVSALPDNCHSVDGALLAPAPACAGPKGICVLPAGDGINHETSSAKSVYDISDVWLRQ